MIFVPLLDKLRKAM